MNSFTEFERLEGELATQDLVKTDAMFSISDYLSGSEDIGSSKQDRRFLKAVSVSDINKREKERVPKKTQQNTVWAKNIFLAWAQYRNKQLVTLEEEYPTVSENFEIRETYGV